MSQAVRTALDLMTVELGKKQGQHYRAEFTVKDVLGRLGKPNTTKNQNYVKYVVGQRYQESKVLLGQGDNGGLIQMKIWSV